MKKILFNIVLALAAAAGLSSCGYDNFDEPETTFTGSVRYKGESLQLRGTSGAVCVQLYQVGFPLKSPINVYVNQDGKFSARVFKGHYKLVTRDNNGPWVNSRDSIDVNVKGATNVDIEVKPYFLLGNVTATVSGNTVTATFNIERIVDDAAIESVYLCFGHTMLCDAAQNDFRIDIPASDLHVGQNSVTRTFTDAQIKKMKSIGYTRLVTRIGLKSTATSECIYSPVITLK